MQQVSWPMAAGAVGTPFSPGISTALRALVISTPLVILSGSHSEGNYQETDKMDGVRWARAAHYEDLVYARAWDDFANAAKDRVLGDYFREKLRTSGLMEDTSEGDNPYLRVYLEGWKSGVEQFWSEVCDKL